MINVIKRNGKKEQYNVDKIHRVLESATEGITGVSISDIEMHAQLNIQNGIKTEEIHNVLVKSASDLISEETPNYQYVAARLAIYQLRKNVWGNINPPKLIDHIKRNIKNDIYDSIITEKYTTAEIHKIETFIKHDRDFKYTYAGIQQMIDKYLIKNRNTGKIYETPQFAYICIAMVLFRDYPESTRLDWIKKAYDYFSLFKINLPTPIVAGVRTKIRQFSSCILIDCDDSLNSIFTSSAIAGKYTARRAGIGLNVGRIRPKNSQIRNGEVVHTGIIPYLKLFESSVKSTSQNGIRGGCYKKGTKVLVVDSVEIDGVTYKIDELDESVHKLLQNGNHDYIMKIILKSKNIEDVSINDTVLSFNEEFQKNEIKKVLNTYINNTTIQISLYTSNGLCLSSSEIHRYRTSNGWILAKDLVVNDVLFDENNKEIKIEKISVKEVSEDFYDLEVDENHNYYAGNGLSWVNSHNSATCSIPIWHYEIEDVMQLKNNSGTDDNRVRKLDYCIQFSKLFYDRLLKKKDITLLSPHECKGLYDAFGTDEFDALYEKYEKDDTLQFKKVVPAIKLFEIYARERLETGRIYSMNIDHCNKNGSWKEKVNMTNLCVEIVQCTKPSNSETDQDGEIGVCTLAAINMLEVKEDSELEIACELCVRLLDEVIDFQDYPYEAAKRFAQNKRSLGIGLTNLAAYLATNKIQYYDDNAPKFAGEFMEKTQYWLLSASCKLAQEKGKCADFSSSKYSDGLLPIDWYNKNVDEFYNQSIMNWEVLRGKIKEHGLRNCTVTAQMPCESCLEWNTKIHTKDGLMNFHEIAEKLGIDSKRIEENEEIGWHVSDKTIEILTTDGFIETNKIYYNGFKDVTELVMEDGSKIYATMNHKFLVNNDKYYNREEKDEYAWFKVDELRAGFKILTIDFRKLKINEINNNVKKTHTWDIESPVNHNYIIENNLISHNSSVIQNSTNSIEPVRELMTVKKAKNGKLKLLVPQYSKYKNYYSKAFDIGDNIYLIKINAAIQKWMDMAMSTNLYYNYFNYEGKTIPLSVILRDQVLAYKYGLKNLYYANTPDGDYDQTTTCAGGACSI